MARRRDQPIGGLVCAGMSRAGSQGSAFCLDSNVIGTPVPVVILIAEIWSSSINCL